MHRKGLFNHLFGEGCELSEKLSDDDCDVILHYLYDSQFKAIPKDIKDFDSFAVVDICEYLGVRVADEFEDWRHIYHLFRRDINNLFM